MKALQASIFLLLFITSCQFDYYEKPQFFLTQSDLEYFEFPTGSWWVYEDSVSLKRDSVILLSSDKRIIEEDELIPLTGSQPNHIENNIINKGPKKKCGAEINTKLILIIILSMNVSLYIAAEIPALIPKKIAIERAVIASV